jgi:hypothetical protein
MGFNGIHGRSEVLLFPKKATSLSLTCSIFSKIVSFFWIHSATLKVTFPDRNREFEQVSQRGRDTIERQDDTIVEAIEEIDELCRVCPDCRDDRCQNSKGDEEAVRKWDGIIVKGLEINYGEMRTSKEWRMLINQKAPLNFCETRCPYRLSCTIFQLR